MTFESTSSADDRRKTFLLQENQPGLLGLMDGSVSTLVPIFATAGLTGRPLSAFFVGLAASLGAKPWNMETSRIARGPNRMPTR